MAKLAYYASRIAPDKPHQLETPEGFRIYLSVPICRSGYQDYLGKEIKGHPDYDPKWNLADDEVVKVFRPPDVVIARETIASFEGKSVTDGHPPAEVALVMVENEAEYGKGHMQNVRVGPKLEDGEADGAVSLLADLWVKDQPLNDKIDGGVRDVSCGYIYGLKRDSEGTIAMTRICGNHVAVVPRGRAGPEVSIRDEKPAALAAETKQPIHQERKPMSQTKHTLFGRMLKAFAKDAEPEEVAEAAKMGKDAEEDKPFEKKEGVNYDVDFYWDSANQKAVPIRGSKGYSKRKAGDDAEEVEGEGPEESTELHPDLKKHIADTKAGLDAIAEHLGVGKEKKEPEAEETTGDANVLEIPTDDQGKTELPKQIAAADSAEVLGALRPQVITLKDPAITKAFNERVRTIKAAAAAHDSVYSGLANPNSPHGEKGDDVDPSTFFNGVSYAEGQRRYNEYLAKKGGK